MKKSLLAVAVLGAMSGAAFAQVAPNNITLYGLIDTSIQGAKQSTETVSAAGVITTTEASISRLASGALSGSRWGLRGSEDLGGGLKANFVLESGFNADTGISDQGGRLFGRRLLVGVGGSFGSFDLGRDLSPLFYARGAVDVEGTATLGALNNTTGISGATLLSLPTNAGLPAAERDGITLFNQGVAQINAGLGTTLRQENAIFYTTPNIAGFTGRVSYSFGEVAGQSSQGKSIGLSGIYNAGPLRVSAGYHDYKSPRSAAITTVVLPTGGTLLTDTKSYMVGASYDFGAALVSAQIGQTKFDSSYTSGATTFTLDDKIKDYNLGVRVPFGAAHFIASYGQAKAEDAKTKAFTIGGGYELSRRTNVYVRWAQVKNSNGGVFGGSVLGGLSASSEGKARVFAAGVRHSF